MDFLEELPTDSAIAFEPIESWKRFVQGIDAITGAQPIAGDTEERGRLFSAIKRFASTFPAPSFSEHQLTLLDRRFADLRSSYVRYSEDQEEDAASRFLSFPLDETEAFQSKKRLLAAEEGRLLRLGRSSTLALIGCGGFPWTGMLLCRTFGCTVIGIERNPRLATIARMVIRRAGLSRQMSIAEDQGYDYNFQAISDVLLSAMAEDKEKIFKQVELTGRSDVQIVARSAIPPYQVFYERFCPMRLGAFSLSCAVRTPGVSELESFIFRRSICPELT